MRLQQGRQHVLLQGLPHWRVAKKGGHADQQLLGQQVQFGGIARQQLRVGLHHGNAVNAHATLNAPKQRAALVEEEVVAAARLQQAQDRHKVLPVLVQVQALRVVVRND